MQLLKEKNTGGGGIGLIEMKLTQWHSHVLVPCYFDIQFLPL